MSRPSLAAARVGGLDGGLVRHLRQASADGRRPGRVYEPRPVGWRAPRDAVAWRTHARLLVDELAGRRDLRATLTAVVDELAVRWHPRTQTSGPGHDQLAAAVATATGRGRCDQATVTRAIARLTEWSLIWEAAPGTIVVGRDGLENLRAEYGLALPPLPRLAAGPAEETGGAASSQDGLQGHKETGWPLPSVPVTKAQRQAAAARLQREAPSLRGCSQPALAATLREWFQAGWSGRDVLTALDFKPGVEGAWTYTTSIRSVVGWVGYRLNAWRDETGRPTASPSQRRAAARARDRERHQRLSTPVPGALVDEQKAAAVARCRAALTQAAGPQGNRLDAASGVGMRGTRPAVESRSLGSRNADPSSSYLSVGESLRARETAQTTTPSGVGIGAQEVKAALAAARARPSSQTSRRAGPTLAELHSRGVPQLWRGGTV